MIDIHAHILPGVDDGSDSMEESLEMAEIAAICGTKTLVATPHCNIQNRFENYEDTGGCGEVCRRLQGLVEKNKIPVQILRGMEIFGVGDIRQLILERKLISLNHSGYYLIEFTFVMHPDEIYDALHMVFDAHGVPIIAHPERYYCVKDTPQLIYEWMREGVLTQVNKGSFLGDFGRREERTAVTLLDHNLITCLASDSHGTKWRSTDMRDAYRYMRTKVYEELTDRLFVQNPHRILSGKRVTRDDISYIREKRWFV